MAGRTGRKAWLGLAIGVLSIAMVIALGAVLRLDDPTSTSVIPAEDPYTHMALTQEHLRDGEIEPLYSSGSLYPPGLHAFLAATWSFTGMDLYEIVRFGPTALGTVGILGMALLLWRNEGPVAGFVGGLAYAVAPELIFRTTMMAPTALDLALVPFLLYALVEMVKGRLAWAWAAAPMSLFLVIAHPWLFAILGAAGGVFALLAFGLHWRPERAPLLTPRGFTAAVAVIGMSVGIALFMGAFYILELPDSWPVKALGPVVMGLALLPLALVLAFPDRAARFFQTVPRMSVPLWVRAGLSAVLALVFGAMTVIALGRGLPEDVSLVRMLGWPILLLAGAAFLALPFARSPVAYLGAAIFAITFPFVVFNPLNSPFWPHRTVAFMAIGMVILVGVAARLIMATAVWAGSRASRTRVGAPLMSGRGVFSAALPILLVAVPLGGGVYAVTPEQYDGWYRLYHDCEMDAMKALVEEVEQQPHGIVISGTWQPNAVMMALAEDTSHVWYKEEFFTVPEVRENLERSAEKEGWTLYVLLERHYRLEGPDADLGFLEEDPWGLHRAECAGGGISEPRIKIYRLEVNA